MRIPTEDDSFLLNNAGRMFELLISIYSNPPGVPLDPAQVGLLNTLMVNAFKDGIDTIGVAENGVQTWPD